MLQGIYLSADELEQAGAFFRGYRQVCQHPGEVGALESNEVLVIDFDHILFDDRALAAEMALKEARRGARVGIHTYHPKQPLLAPLRAEPNLVIRKTHDRVHAAMLQIRHSGAVAAMPAA